MLIPGEPVWGVRLSAKQPGTKDDDYQYALVWQVSRNHSGPATTISSPRISISVILTSQHTKLIR